MKSRVTIGPPNSQVKVQVAIPDDQSHGFEAQRIVLGPLVRVIQEAADDAPWALIGAASLALQGIEATSSNLEFMVTEDTLHSLAAMLDLEPKWGRGTHLAAERLHFMRHGVPVFVLARPVFHGRYESLSPFDVPALWDARALVDARGTTVTATPAEWELMLAVVLGIQSRTELLGEHLREHGFDNRLLTRLLRESRVKRDTEEAVWAVLERSD